LFLRLVATIGIIGIGVGVGAVLSSNKVQGWIIGLVVALVTFVLTVLLRSMRQLRS
jgi:ribose 5-phosphate isomerase RpiB